MKKKVSIIFGFFLALSCTLQVDTTIKETDLQPHKEKLSVLEQELQGHKSFISYTRSQSPTLLSNLIISEEYPNDLDNRSILFIGDSITCNTWQDNPHADTMGNLRMPTYPFLVKRFLEENGTNSTVVISGHPSHSTEFGKNNILPIMENTYEFIDKYPDYVVLAWGMNDYGRYNYEERVYGELSYQIDYLLSNYRNSVPIIMTSIPVARPYYYGGREDDNYRLENIARIQREISEKEGVDLVDVRKDFYEYASEFDILLNQFELHVDNWHPNQQGHWILAKSFLEHFNYDVETQNPYFFWAIADDFNPYPSNINPCQPKVEGTTFDYSKP
ncbi:SGNH/GDSL hydrolase family protein [Candidatus Woesearchaeota archaeon]|nr:SGNH/GDSL hydrolase family protein [Candidatus Woesearchaeota archaeon]